MGCWVISGWFVHRRSVGAVGAVDAVGTVGAVGAVDVVGTVGTIDAVDAVDVVDVVVRRSSIVGSKSCTTGCLRRGSEPNRIHSTGITSVPKHLSPAQHKNPFRLSAKPNASPA